MLAIRYNQRRGTKQEEDSLHQQSGIYLRNKIVKCCIGSIIFMVPKLGRIDKCVRITSQVLKWKRLDKIS
jgi:hypothetical protein